MARRGAEILFNKIANTQANQLPEQKMVKMLFPVELVVRRSCGCS
jgi:DNA-binding LacI/PurR family transcriptional regulator